MQVESVSVSGMVTVLLCLLCVSNLISWTYAQITNHTNGTSTSDSASSPSDANGALPNPNNEWERHTLMNVVIVAMVILVVIGGLFFVRYMRTEKKNALRRYSQLNKMDDDDDDIELSIYEKKE